MNIQPFCTFKTLIRCILTGSSSNSAGAGGIPPGVSAELMSLLSSIRLARVAIDSLAVSTGGATGAHRKTPSKGKPPRAVTGKKWWVKHFK